MALSALALSWDTSITSLRHSKFIPGDLRRIIQLSEIFGHGFGIAIVSWMLWLLAPDKRRFIPRVAACAVLPGLVAVLVKLFVFRRRPGFYWPEYADQVANTWVGFFGSGNLHQFNVDYVTQSFPSAHAATAIGLASGLAWLFPRGRFAFFGLGMLAAFQRVFAGAHWTSDVLAGAAVGVLVCGFLLRSRSINLLFARIENQEDRMAATRMPMPIGELPSVDKSDSRAA